MTRLCSSSNSISFWLFVSRFAIIAGLSLSSIHRGRWPVAPARRLLRRGLFIWLWNLARSATIRTGSRSVSGISAGKRDHVRLFHGNRRECYSLSLGDTVLAPQVPIGFHCQRATVLVSKPTGNGWDVHTAFDATRRKQMAQIVMRDSFSADFLACAIQRLLAFANTKHFLVERFVGSVAAHTLKQRTSIWDKWDAT